MAIGPTTNSIRGEAAIKLDRTRHLKITFDTARRFQESTGVSILAIMPRVYLAQRKAAASNSDADINDAVDTIKKHLGDDRLVVAVWALLTDEDPKLRIEDVPRLMEMAEGTGGQKEAYIVDCVLDAFFLRRGIDARAGAEDLKKNLENLAKEAAALQERNGISSASSPTTTGESSSRTPSPS